MSNPMDALEVTYDLIRRTECEYLFRELNRRNEEHYYGDEVHDGVQLALNLLDERIGHLRDKWTDAVE